VTVDWYFDFISPFAYLQWARLGELPPAAELRLQPVLLAGILNHWGQLGPAEIAPKRRFTYQHATWLAARTGLPFTMPAGHPFNSLPLLRLAWSLGTTRPLVERLFRFVWVEGHIPQQPEPWAALLDELGLSRYEEMPQAKQQLRAATDAAIACGVFGVPTAVTGGQLFWGYDATDMLLDYCRDPGLLDTAAMHRAAQLPVAAARPAKPR
jgi:2-hydroxychromene-2-carboxylate isomerase